MSSANNSAAAGKAVRYEPFGNPIKFAEPAWYQSGYTRNYRQSHVQIRGVLRKFVDEELSPNIDKWLIEGYPTSLHQRAYELGITGLLYPKEFGGTRPDDFDAFHEVILWDEIYRCGAQVLQQLSINSMALPPIMNFGSQAMKQRIVPPVVTGKKNICLMISEPSAGSDVASVQTTAIRQGDFYIVNGQKKWITGGTIGDFFTTLVRTGPPGSGAGGLSLLLLERSMPGIKIRKMPTQFDTTHSTAFVDLEDVKVPIENSIGNEGAGFKIIMRNFNHERLVIACQACRSARLCYSESVQECMRRKTFGKYLHEHQIVRFKLAEMARMIESLQANIENVALQFASGVPDGELGAECALLKVHGSKVFEYCAREAIQIFGGSGLVKEGRGKIVERLYRDVKYTAIPGGSEEILLDLAARQVVAKASKL